MKTGHKPMPRNLRLLRGVKDQTVGKPAKPIEEPRVTIPPPPEGLTPEQIDTFVDLARKLAGMRIMSEADVDALVIYCRNWVDAKSARVKVNETGYIVKSPRGFPVMNPYLAIARKAEDRCLRILVEFGLTPSSRNRVSEP